MAQDASGGERKRESRKNNRGLHASLDKVGYVQRNGRPKKSYGKSTESPARRDAGPEIHGKTRESQSLYIEVIDGYGKRTKTSHPPPCRSLRSTPSRALTSNASAPTSTNPPETSAAPAGKPSNPRNTSFSTVCSTTKNLIRPSSARRGTLPPLPPLLLHQGGAEKMSKFLQYTRAFSKPESGPPLYVPLEPD
ncbi:hypothetical protein EDB92DRAFT_375245 [Lactarius akahatsu]|uniref:Uncharacterized protein n=1 Tax=Lactarius akahatsu TaxID=416441 RepID=A0AAD4LHS9_9AGAM|nr:hypothetical protein EDB92DRAFT_375245 [Lactarius akahatsu]